MKYKGSCHCGKVSYEFDGDISSGMACNCSMCKRKGTLLSFIQMEQFKLLSGKNDLTDYQFGKKHIHHYFCSTCGVTSFATGKSPAGVEMTAINLRCVDGVDVDALKINKVDGASF